MSVSLDSVEAPSYQFTLFIVWTSKQYDQLQVVELSSLSTVKRCTKANYKRLFIRITSIHHRMIVEFSRIFLKSRSGKWSWAAGLSTTDWICAWSSTRSWPFHLLVSYYHGNDTGFLIPFGSLETCLTNNDDCDLTTNVHAFRVLLYPILVSCDEYAAAHAVSPAPAAIC